MLRGLRRCNPRSAATQAQKLRGLRRYVDCGGTVTRRRRNPRNAMCDSVDCGDAVLYIALAQTERFYATPNL